MEIVICITAMHYWMADPLITKMDMLLACYWWCYGYWSKTYRYSVSTYSRKELKDPGSDGLFNIDW